MADDNGNPVIKGIERALKVRKSAEADPVPTHSDEHAKQGYEADAGPSFLERIRQAGEARQNALEKKVKLGQ